MNFGAFGNSSSSTKEFAPLNLDKGDILDLTKEVPSLNHIAVCAGWRIAAVGKENIDLDLSAFLLDDKGRVKDPSTQVVYFKQANQQGIYLEDDNQVGSDDDDDGDAEIMHAALDDISPKCQSILFNVNIFKCMEKRQTFGMVRNSYIRLLDEDHGNRELLRYELKENASSATAITFARLDRTNSGGWEFHAVGEALTVKDLNQLLIRYIG